MKNDFIYDVMGSKIMRDYYRENNIELSTKQKQIIITKCYKSITEQLEYLKLLFDSVDEEEQKSINEMIQLYGLFIKLFYNPEEVYPNSRFFYKVQWIDIKYNLCDNFPIERSLETYIKKSYDYQNIKDIFYEIGDDCKESELYELELFIIDDKKIFNPINFYCTSINGIFVPFRCEIVDLLDDHNKFTKSIEIYEDDGDRLDMPFKHEDIIKIHLPIMKIPLYGCISREFSDSWYNFLYKSKDDLHNTHFLDMSRINIDLYNIGSLYSVFDWLKRE